MLKLTNESGGECYVNVANVLSVHAGTSGQTTILFPGNSYISVQESAEEVARMVDEAKAPEMELITEHPPSPLSRAAPDMYALLKEIGTGVSGPIKYCPSCGLGLYRHHAPDCRLAAVLKAVEGEG